MTGMVPLARPRDGATALLPVLLALFGPLVYVAPLGAVPGLLALCVAAALVAWRARVFAGWAILGNLAVFAPLVCWMALSSFWALDATAAVSLALRLTGVFAAGVMLVHWARRLPLSRLGPCLPAMAVGFTVAGAIMLVDLVVFHGALARHMHAPRGDNYDVALFYGRGATIQAILIVPLTLGLWRHGARRLALAQFVVGVLAIFMAPSLSAKMALGAALSVGGAVFVLPRLRFALLGLLVPVIAFLPALLPYRPDPDLACWLSNHKPSALHRLYIWDFAAERIAQHPLFGWGLDAARRIPGGDDRIVIRGCDSEHRPTKRLAVDSTVMPLHPHNAILQLWLELGGIGVVLGFGAVLLALGRAFRRRRWLSRPAQAGFISVGAAGLAVALVSFGVWQEWFLAALFVAAAMAVLAARATEAPPDQDGPRRLT